MQSDGEDLVGEVVVDCRTGRHICEGEVLREPRREEGCYKRQDFVARFRGTRKTLDDLWLFGAKEATAEKVLGEVVGVEGEPVGFVETLEAHGHSSGGAFSERRELVRLDILGELNLCVGDGLSRCVECAVEERFFPGARKGLI